MVQKLAAQGLVTHRPYGPIALSEEGELRAAAIIRRHRLIETWLVREFGYGWDEVHDEAEVLEHTLSDRLLDAIAVQLGNPERDPHGDPIPSQDGAVEIPDAVLLSSLDAGSRGRVARISDRDGAVLRELAAAGVGLDSDVKAGALEPRLADAVWVVRLA